MRLLLIMLVSVFSLTTMHVYGQTDEVKKEINKIKKSSRYIYAEATAPTETDAKAYAEAILYDEINKWMEMKKHKVSAPSLIVNNKKELWTTLSMPRGSNMYRAFVYVKKSDIEPTDNAVVIPNQAAPPVSKKVKFEVPEIIANLAKYKTFNELASLAMKLKKNGTIKSCDRYDKLQNSEACYLVIFNNAGDILAILSPGGERVNIRTNEKEPLIKYKGCGVIGIEL